MQDGLLTAEVCRRIKASKTVVNRLAAQGHIGYWRPPGGRRRFVEADVDRIVMSGWTPACKGVAAEAAVAQ